eukprot:1331360-Rhodomonas_salina.3
MRCCGFRSSVLRVTASGKRALSLHHQAPAALWPRTARATPGSLARYFSTGIPAAYPWHAVCAASSATPHWPSTPASTALLQRLMSLASLASAVTG